VKLHAVIKGKNEDTLTACVIKYSVKVLQYNVNVKDGYIYAAMEVEDMETIHRWYDEDQGPPFPDGALLYWMPVKSGDTP